MVKGESQVDICGREGALLALAEVGFGSILHGLKIPLSGDFLSLNQGFLLTRAVHTNKNAQGMKSLPFKVSSVAALLKSLAPAGKKLTPMLAISAQGFLYSAGLFILGVNFAGIFLGSLLLSLWSFAQPFLLYYLLYGQKILTVAESLVEKLNKIFPFTSETLILVIAGAICVKLILAFLTTLIALRLSPQAWEVYAKKISAKTARSDLKNRKGHDLGLKKNLAANMGLALRDLFSPLFVVSLVLVFLFYFYAESSLSGAILAVLRPLALGFCLFLAVRLISFEAILLRLERSRFKNFGQSLRVALRSLQER